MADDLENQPNHSTLEIEPRIDTGNGQKTEEIPLTPEERQEMAYQQQVAIFTQRADERLREKELAKIHNRLQPPGELTQPEPVLTLRDIRRERRRSQSQLKNAAESTLNFLDRRVFRNDSPELDLPDFVTYLEHNCKITEYTSVSVANDEIEKTKASYTAQGYQLSSDITDHHDQNKRNLYITRTVPYHFDPEEASTFARFLNTHNDPVEILERLKRLGREFLINDMRSDNWFHDVNEHLLTLMDTPHLAEVLAKLEAAGVNTRYFSGHNDPALIKLCKPEYLAQLDDERLARFRNLGRVAGSYADIDLLAQLIENKLLDPENYDAFNTLYAELPYDFAVDTIQELKKNNLLGQAITMLRSGIFYSQQLFINSKFNREQAAESYTDTFKTALQSPVVAELRDNSDITKFLQTLNATLGIKINIADPEDLIKIKELMASPDTIAFSEALTYLNIDDLSFHVREHRMVNAFWEKAVNRDLKRKVMSSEFQSFMTAFGEKYGYHFALYDLSAFFGKNISYLVDHDRKNDILSDKTAGLYRAIHQLFDYRFRAEDIDLLLSMSDEYQKWQRILQNPDFVNLINKSFSAQGSDLETLLYATSIDASQIPTMASLHELFAYKVDKRGFDQRNDLAGIANLHQNLEKQAQLFNPTRVEITNRIVRLIGHSNVSAYDQGGFKPNEIDFYLGLPLEINRVLKLLDSYPHFGLMARDCEQFIKLADYDDAAILTAIKAMEETLVAEDKQNRSTTISFKFTLTESNLASLLTILEHGFTSSDIESLQEFSRRIYDSQFAASQSYYRKIAASKNILTCLPQLITFRDNEALITSLHEEIDHYLRPYTTYRQPPDLEHIDQLILIHHANLIGLYRKNKNSQEVLRFIDQNIKAIAAIPAEKQELYVDILAEIDESPSQEIQRLKHNLMAEILECPDPMAAYRKIEQVFIKNNLPLVGKIFRIFETLYQPRALQSKIDKAYSPTLKRSTNRVAYHLIYRDLLNIHIDSGNRSLQHYVEALAASQDVLRKAEIEGFDQLTTDEQKQIRALFARLTTLFENSQLGRNVEMPETSVDLQQQYDALKSGLRLSAGQTITDRIADMFLRPANLKNLDQVSQRMSQAKMRAHQRNIQLATETPSGYIPVNHGDLLKGVDEHYIENILQNGSVAKEYLGGTAESDGTPLDTDVSMITEADIEGTTDAQTRFAAALTNSLASNYGTLILGIRDRGQFSATGGKPEKYELFGCGSDLRQFHHGGIRTGFASTEIDFIIRKSNAQILPDRLFCEIAQNGYYIPVVDETGQIIFTPEMYQQFRDAFDGLSRFDGEPLEITKNQGSEKTYNDIEKTKHEITRTEPKVKKATSKIKSVIEETLAGLGITFKEKYDLGILGARLDDTGSTGRGTSIDKNFDFDLLLRLDAKDFPKASAFAQNFIRQCTFEANNSHSEPNGYYQVRLTGVTSIAHDRFDPPIDVDIGFAKSSELAVFGSHEAAEERLNWIETNLGSETRQEVVANIVLAKKILKAGEAYKKLEDGGMGGIGVENWILQNHGNIALAFETFLQAAKDEQGNMVPFAAFQSKYHILDPGINLKHLSHDNYIRVLKADGYKKMLETIEDYLSGKLTIE